MILFYIEASLYKSFVIYLGKDAYGPEGSHFPLKMNKVR